jgi:hypothetical protein
MAMKPTKRKMRRFDEGGYTEDSEALADENYGDGTTREERLAMVRSMPRSRSEGTPAPMDAMEAANASKDAQAIMDEAKGESILKRMRDEAAAPKRAAAPMARPKPAPAVGGSRNTRTGATAGERSSAGSAPAMGGSRNTRTGPSAAELESYSKQQAIKKAMTAPSKEDTQKGLEIMAGAPGLKTIAAAAKGLANRAPAMAEKAREYIQPALAAPTKRLTGPAAKEATDVSPKLLTGPKGAEVSAKGREEVTNPMMWMGGPKNAGKFKEGAKRVPKKAKKALDESDTTGGAVGYKKGGNVRGWGIARGARKAKIV